MEETPELSISENARALFSVMAERVTGLTSQTVEETLAVEEPLEIQLGYGPAESRAVKSISVTMRTPGYDFELAAGFLMTEGVVRDVNDIERIAYAGQRLDRIDIGARHRAAGGAGDLYAAVAEGGTAVHRIEVPGAAATDTTTSLFCTFRIS